MDDKDLASATTQAQRCQNLADSNQWTDATYCWGDMEDLVGRVSFYAFQLKFYICVGNN